MNKIVVQLKIIIKKVINECYCLLSVSKVRKLKNSQEGKRCFVVGNGPSLRAEDLEKLREEKTFSSNRVYNIFDKTSWRSTYYCVQDYKLILQSSSDIAKMSDYSLAFVGRVPFFKYPKFKNFLNVRSKIVDFYPELPEFSQDISKYVLDGWTVTYMCLQIAIYMGFKEIYLLGVDHSYSVTLEPDGSVKHFKGVADHFSEKDKIDNLPVLYKSTLAYEAAKKYADEHGIKIYNATRGGKLEVFERVDFDTLFD